MTDRQAAQSGLDAQTAKQGSPDSITPANQVSETLQPFLDASMMVDEGVKSSWVNPFDDYTILATDNRIDGFPDNGTPANATYTLLAPSSYPSTWSCDIYNDTFEDWIITINDDQGSQVYELLQGAGCNVRVNDTNDGFIFVAIKGTAPIVLDPAVYGDFNNFTVWQRLTGPRFVMPNATAAQISNFAPEMVFDGGSGITYTFDINQRNDSNGYLIEVLVTSVQDSTNPGVAREYRRFGPDMPTSTGNPWVVDARLDDTVQTEFINVQSYLPQQPVDTATPLRIQFDDSSAGVNPGGAVELLDDNATIKFNQTGTYTIDLSAAYGRDAATAESDIILYGGINLTTNATTTTPDSDFLSFGRVFPYVLDNQRILISAQYSGKYLQIDSLPASFRYYVRRLPPGANDGGLFAVDLSGVNHFGTPYAGNGASSAGISAWRIGESSGGS